MQKLAVKVLLLVLINCCFSFAKAAKVDTVLTYSASMKKQIKAVVILPDTYKDIKKFPVLYLLHGYSGNYGDYVNNVPEIKALSSEYQMIIVCVDGNYGSWYIDSPADSSWKYETYIATELVNWIDHKYKTIKAKSGRAICGLSMGGHGAFYLAFRHQDIFGAAGSMSGGVDLRPFLDNWDINKRLGDYANFPDRWDNYSVINQIYLLKPNSLALIMACGNEDFFYKVNLNLHEKLLERNIPHTYLAGPGGHS